MTKVTKEGMRALFDAGVYPPRHQRGCRKNLARMMPMLLLGQGHSISEIRKIVVKKYKSLPCDCRP